VVNAYTSGQQIAVTYYKYNYEQLHLILQGWSKNVANREMFYLRPEEKHLWLSLQ